MVSTDHLDHEWMAHLCEDVALERVAAVLGWAKVSKEGLDGDEADV